MTIRRPLTPGVPASSPAPLTADPRIPDATDRWLCLGLVTYALGIAAWLWTSRVQLTWEDGYYYFKIAQNLAQGEGCTFDGWSMTNGFHPLWLLLLVAVHLLASAGEPALIVGVALQAVLLAISAVLIYFSARLFVARGPALLAAVVWIFLIHRLALGGLEFGLHALCLLALACVHLRRMSDHEGPPGVGACAVLGLLAALTFLARLDTLLLGLILALSLLATEARHGFRRGWGLRLGAFAAPLLATLVIYVALSVHWFGTPLPVSGAVKRAWSAQLLAEDRWFESHGWLVAKLVQAQRPLRNVSTFNAGMIVGVLVSLAVLLADAWSGWRHRHRSSRAPRWARSLRQLRPFALYAVAGYLAYVVTYHRGHSFSPWYYVMQPWMVVMAPTAVLAALVAEADGPSTPGQARRQIAVGLLVGLVVLAQAASLGQWREEWRARGGGPLHSAASFVRTRLPQDAVVGAWNAGAIAYQSQRRVVNLDGLANSQEFFTTARHDLCAYWDAVGVTHLVDLFGHDRQRIGPVPAYPSYAHCCDRLELIWDGGGDDQGTWRVQAYALRPIDEGLP